MRNGNSCFVLETAIDPVAIFPSYHGVLTSSSSNALLLLPCMRSKEEAVMFLLHASSSLCFLLLLFHLLCFLLIKFFTFLHNYKRDVASADGEELAGDVGGGGEEEGEEGLFFWYGESVFDDSQLVDQGEEYSIEQHCLEVEDTFVEESPCISPLKNLAPVKVGIEGEHDVLIADVLTPSDCVSPIVSTCENLNLKEEDGNKEETRENNEEKGLSKDAKLLVNNSFKLDSKRFEEKESYGSSLVGESTSKSSMEWQSSTITKDSEMEYPFSSSSRRSSSNWESYTLFRKYDEEMMYFNRIGTQKLAETESFRSIKYQPRSISQRIVHKLTTKHRSYPAGVRDPYQELESAYVAQICLTWEALNWNYSNFSKLNANRDVQESFCPARIAQEFQQFEVLLQRFIENEPYEYGRRPEVYARRRISSPKLLLVPEFREADDGKEDLISSTEFLVILQQAIRTFMNFLKADKQSHYQKLKSLMRKRSSSVDKTLLSFLKKANKRKKLRIKDLVKQRRCLKKRRLKVDEEMEILMGLIDMKVVSRVLRMPEISEEQLHWCEERMTKVRIWDGKIQRDSAPLFFPVH
ncbi:uncharacterized protein [Typha angustifolia]|uniref:uncharacterized protein n=1 Tax=Typha angustifolia TaxID=59011 RepID=UPI003C2AAE6C